MSGGKPKIPGRIRLRVRAVELAEANDFVARLHRHHKRVVGHRFSLGAFRPLGVRAAWSKDTSYFGEFDANNPSRGQCAVTALVVQDLMGGEVLKTHVCGQSHYLNLVDGQIVDLTADQFGGVGYDHDPEEASREYLLSSPQTALRYYRLSKAASEDVLCGVAVVGRPVARKCDQRRSLEVTRLATDGTPNACSALYAAAARAGAALGYERIQTYILDTEPGTSLKASGWVCEGEAGGGQWDHTGDPWLFDGPNRRTDQPIGKKMRWAKELA